MKRTEFKTNGPLLLQNPNGPAQKTFRTGRDLFLNKLTGGVVVSGDLSYRIGTLSSDLDQTAHSHRLDGEGRSSPASSEDVDGDGGVRRGRRT
jgi:hypothetical protein